MMLRGEDQINTCNAIGRTWMGEKRKSGPFSQIKGWVEHHLFHSSPIR